MKEIIVIADPAGGKNVALKRALQLQKTTRAKVILLGFCYANVGRTGDRALSALSRKELEEAVTKKRTKELKETLKKFNVTARQVVVNVMWSKDITKAVLAYCKQHSDSILIKSSSRSNSWLHTSTDWQLIRDCRVPFMLTAGKSWKKKARIVASIDFATASRPKQALNAKIVAQAKMLANQLDDELHLAFAITVPEILADMDLINPRRYVADKRKALAPIIQAFCESHDIDPTRVHIKQGPADKVIPSIASKLKADIVVAGTIGRKGIKGKLIGNTAEGILSNLYTDILTVRP